MGALEEEAEGVAPVLEPEHEEEQRHGNEEDRGVDVGQGALHRALGVGNVGDEGNQGKASHSV